jgi:hypothetical protein
MSAYEELIRKRLVELKNDLELFGESESRRRAIEFNLWLLSRLQTTEAMISAHAGFLKPQ